MTEQFRTEVPNIIDDLGLDPFERVLYLHYKRVCGAYGGVCYEAVRTTAQKTKMAMGMVTKARESLQARGLITTLARKHKNDTPNIMIVDIWDLNQAYYLEIGRPNVDGWTVEQLRQWVESVHSVNAVEHNPSECSPGEDSHNKRSLHERTNDELSSSEQLPPEMPVSVHKVNDNEHSNIERSPGETKKDSSLSTYPNKESLQDSSPYGEGGEPPPPIDEPPLVAIPEVEPELEQPAEPVENPAKHPAIQAYRSVANRYPDKATWEMITTTVGRDPPDVAFWGNVVRDYIACGWNKTNVKTMLEHYERRELPKQTKNGATQNGFHGSSQNLPRSNAGHETSGLSETSTALAAAWKSKRRGSRDPT